MIRTTSAIGLAGALALGACTVAPPEGPSMVAMPGQGRSYEAFQNDDYTCRQAASASIGDTTPGQAAAGSAVGSAAVGTAVGAAAGALIGSAGGAAGAGAAIGAGAGLLAGSSIGAGNAQASGYSLQRRYDVTYAQCMTAKGNQISQPPVAAAAYPYPYAYPAPYYYRPRAYYGYPYYY